MSEERINKILDKIRKLFALAGNNPNENESASAAEMARKLLDAYNLSISDIELKEIVEKQIIFETFRIDSWKGWVARIVSEVFDCVAYLTKESGTSKMVFVGNTSDVEVAVYVYQYLLKTIENLIKVRLNDTSEHGKTIKHHYSMGIVSVLRDRLNAFYGSQKEVHAEQKNAFGMTGREVMVVKQDAIQKYLNEKDLKLKSSSTTYQIKNQNAYVDGARDGEKISLTRGVGNNGKTPTRYLKSRKR
jgi:hypothetical protein